MKYLIAVLLLIAPAIGQAGVCDDAVARVATMSDAIQNRTVPAQAKLNVAAAFAVKYRSYVVDKGFDPDNLTNAQAACLVLVKTNSILQAITRQNAPGMATAKAAVVTAKEGVTTAASTATSDAETDWPSTDIE